jgi:hypothetical protein
MLDKLRRLAILLAPFVITYFQNRKARPKLVPGAKITWKLTVVVMDGTDLEDKAKTPVTEAVKFIEARTRFKFIVDYIETDVKHDVTPYPNGDMVSYAMLGWNIPEGFIQTLPVSTTYLFLYKLYDKEAAQAGSALGMDFGLKIGGKARVYATAPTDQRWFINVPNQGFQSWAAQILTHEIVNTIQGTVEAPPYNCGQLTGTPGISSDLHESERLSRLTDACYEKLAGTLD